MHEKGAAAVADEMLPKLLGETTRREHPDVVEQVRALVLSNSTPAIAGDESGDGHCVQAVHSHAWDGVRWRSMLRYRSKSDILQAFCV